MPTDHNESTLPPDAEKFSQIPLHHLLRRWDGPRFGVNTDLGPYGTVSISSRLYVSLILALLLSKILSHGNTLMDGLGINN